MAGWSIERRAVSQAPVERVWELLADARSWSSWSRLTSSALAEEAPGPDPNGIGALRRFSVGFGASLERVVAYEPPRHLAYELVSGLPITGYRADVTLAPRPGGGTSIEWRASYRGRPPVVGAAIHAFLGWFLQDTANRLARAAER
ncbi:SRPBCC family protein [bacterium]|nr:SRPBCC family protein [bacterium]